MAGKPTETSPLVGKSAVSWASGYGVEAGSIKAPLGVSFQVDSTEEHRCHLPRQIRPHSLAGIAIGAGSFAQGYDGTAIGFMLLNSFGGYVHMTAWEQGWVCSIFFFGGVIGAYMSSWLNDQLGRRVPLLLAGALVTTAALLGTTTTTLWWLLCVRCLFGVGMGINNASLAIYYAEITPKAERGGVISRTEAYFAVGGIAACIVQLIVQDKLSGAWGEPNGWRVVMGLEAVPGLVMLLGALKCVESPHWLLRRGMSVEAERVLRRIYQPVRNRDGTCDCEEKNGDMTDALDTLARGLEARFFKGAHRERGALESLVHSFRKSFSTLLMLWSPIRRIRRALELILLMASMPLIGIGCIPQQFVPMLLEIGIHGHRKRDRTAITRSTLLVDCGCNVVYLAGSVLTAVVVVDKLGRRMPLVWCLLGAAFGFLLDAGTYDPAVAPPESKRHLAVALVGVMIGYVCRSMGVGPLHQVVGSEVIPLEIAARGTSLYAMTRRATAMVFCLLFPPALTAFGGYKIFAGLSAATFLYTLFVFLRLPETGGYEMSEIENILDTMEWVPWNKQPPPMKKEPSNKDLRALLAGVAAQQGGGGVGFGGAGQGPGGSGAFAKPRSKKKETAQLASSKKSRVFASPDLGA